MCFRSRGFGKKFSRRGREKNGYPDFAEAREAAENPVLDGRTGSGYNKTIKGSASHCPSASDIPQSPIVAKAACGPPMGSLGMSIFC